VTEIRVKTGLGRSSKEALKSSEKLEDGNCMAFGCMWLVDSALLIRMGEQLHC